MKRYNKILILITTITSFFLLNKVSAQTRFGNEWIVNGQAYYKIPTAQDGIYAVPLNTLRQAGVTIASDKIQLFHRGIEQAILINNDTLFFYGKRNDGTLDSLLYDPNNLQLNKYYNLYSDTTAYFVTGSNSGFAGKRMQSLSIPGSTVNQNTHIAESITVYSNSYVLGQLYSVETFKAAGDQGEGWVSNDMGAGSTSNFNIPVSYINTSSSLQSSVEIKFVGRNGTVQSGTIGHNLEIILKDPSQPDLYFNVTTFSNRETRVQTFQFPTTYLNSGNLQLFVHDKGGSGSSTVALCYIKLNYPQNVNQAWLPQKKYTIEPSSSANDIGIQNCSGNSKVFDISDLNDIKTIVSSGSGSGIAIKLPASSFGYKLSVVNNSNYLSIPGITWVDLNSYSNESIADYIILTHNKLMEGATAYDDYRKSMQGGNYKTILAEVNKLYNMFSYGERSPVGIRRFMEYMSSKTTIKYFFIIGKGLVIDYEDYRRNPSAYIYNSNINSRLEDLIPPFGNPPSDLLYVTGLYGKPHNSAAIPTGRQSAKNNTEVYNYLNKVKEHESLSDSLWRKNVLHLSGGRAAYEIINFQNHVNSLKTIVEDTIYGGRVQTISKKTAGTSNSDLVESISEKVNRGVSYMTFMGHSNNFLTDLDIGFVSYDALNYHNKGRYPLLTALGCDFGQVFIDRSIAEDWINTADRGAINCLAHTATGYTGYLYDYSIKFYNKAFNDSTTTGKTVGEYQIKTIESFLPSFQNDEVGIAHAQQILLSGDPAVKNYSPTLPNYEISADKIFIKSFNDKKVNALTDSFAVAIVVSNLGLDFKDSIYISIKRTVNGRIINYGPLAFKNVSYQDTLYFTIRSSDPSTFGENIFEIKIDPENRIIESDETNNTVVFNYFMPFNGVNILFPKAYSIVNKNPVTLIAQSTNLLIGESDFIIELDTSYLFNSPYKRDTLIHTASLIKWKNFNLPYKKDSTVYYWRVRFNSLPTNEELVWANSSFIYISNSPEGWSQTTMAQFSNDNLTQISTNIPQSKWEFSPTLTPIYVKTVGTNYIASNGTSANTQNVISFFGVPYTYNNYCLDNSLLTATFHNSTAMPYTPYNGPAGGAVCGYFDPRTNSNLGVGKRIINTFNNLNDSTTTSPGSSGGYYGFAPGLFGANQNQANLDDYMNSVPTGDYVLFVNRGEAYYDKWSQNIKNRFKNEFGAKLIDSLHNGMSYILFTKKGSSTPIFERYLANSSTGILEMKDTLNGFNNTGYITSPLIGPASSWGTFYHTISSKESNDIDSLMIIRADIYGNNIDTIAISQADALDLSALPQLTQYPNIRLLSYVADLTNYTPAQLKKWQVIYTGVPEGTMNPALAGLSNYTSIKTGEGDIRKVCYAFENISNHDFKDSLLVQFTITNSNHGSTTENIKIAPLKKDSIATFCHSFNTNGQVGSNGFKAFVNPYIQLEEYYNNNVLEISAEVTADKINPVLDVLFDGIHIMNGDIVSPSPLITINLDDENPFKLRTNSDGIDLFWQTPGQSQYLKLDPSLYSGKPVGVNGKNIYRIEYHPVKLPDGKYKLMIKAKDVDGNKSAVKESLHEFEVINASTITNFYVYPNPFSTSARFVFTLTGEFIPQDIIIQIMTITGKVVREITKAELGNIHIGNNKTDYAWDGTDEFGDRLANGVYLYRVKIKNGGDFEHRSTAGDQYFKKDWGKLYILR